MAKQIVTLGGIRADIEIRTALDETAEQMGISVSEVHRRALRSYLGLSEERSPFDEKVEEILTRLLDDRLGDLAPAAPATSSPSGAAA